MSGLAKRELAVLAFVLALLVGCRAFGPVGDLLRPPTPWEEYRDSLLAAEFEQTSAGRAWLAAERRAVARAPSPGLPYREVVYFDQLRPDAAAWRLSLQRGQELRVRLGRPVDGEATLFVDLLRGEGEERESVAALESGTELTHPVRESGPYVLRVQPELLAGGRWTVNVGVGASMTFPVEGRSSAAIGGQFGDPRAGGARSHEGVDIFAPRGTAAVAAADGRVSRVGTNPLGGNVVWLRTDDALGLYYAHLDRQVAETGDRVRAGDVVGRVGNTGNAAGTPPHLHFSVYDDGAVDPYPFLYEPAERAAEVTADLALLGDWVRIGGERVNLRAGPSTDTPVRGQATRDTALRVDAANADWYRVRTGDGPAYVAARLVEGTETPIRRLRLSSRRELLHEPAPAAAVVAEAEAGADLEVLAERGDHLLVRHPAGERPTWLAQRQTP